MIAVSLSLAACLGWGLADFLGGVKSRQLPTLTILIISNCFGVVMIGAIVALRGVPLPINPELLWAVLGGLAGVAAMFMLYRALAIGSIPVLAPLSATGVIIPVVLGVVTGDSLAMLQTLGIFAAILGTIFAAREKGSPDAGRQKTSGVELALGSALAVGFFIIFMDRASEIDPYWAAFIMRCSYGAFLVPLVLLKRPPLRIERSHIPALICMGTVDALAGFAFALATTVGLLSLVSVIGSLYPVVTVLLSAVILREFPQRVQLIGVTMALVGVVLISL